VTQLNLLEGEFACCGTLCDKMVAQARINRMQAVIDEAYKFINYERLMTNKEAEDFEKELEEMKSGTL
jgi:hypothetical protein